MRWSRPLLLLWATALPVACTNLLGLGDHETLRVDTPDGPLADVVDIDGETDAPFRSDTGDAPSPCPGTAGPQGIQFGPTTACIDSTEVSNRHYLAFLEANVDASTQPAICAWNTSFVPAVTAAANDYPVRGVDWCDARAYCAWAGKRLCGKLPTGGDAGRLNIADRLDPIMNQWLNACSTGGKFTFAYGNVYVPGTCADQQTGSVLMAVGTLPNCRTPAGVFDMTGNIVELLDVCEGEAVDPKDTRCLMVGGGYGNGDGKGGAADFNCRTQYTIPRNGFGDDIGFRCCSP